MHTCKIINIIPELFLLAFLLASALEMFQKLMSLYFFTLIHVELLLLCHLL